MNTHYEEVSPQPLSLPACSGVTEDNCDAKCPTLLHLVPSLTIRMRALWGGGKGEKLGEELIPMESKRERKRENDKKKRKRKIKEVRDGK